MDGKEISQHRAQNVAPTILVNACMPAGWTREGPSEWLRKWMKWKRKGPYLHASSYSRSSPRKWPTVDDIFQRLFAATTSQLKKILVLHNMSLKFLGWGEGLVKQGGADRKGFISGSIEIREDWSLFIQTAQWHNQSNGAWNLRESPAYLYQIT